MPIKTADEFWAVFSEFSKDELQKLREVAGEELGDKFIGDIERLVKLSYKAGQKNGLESVAEAGRKPQNAS